MATVVLRQGVYVDQYAVDDLGGEFDNNRMIISHNIPEVLIQVSGVNYHTSKANLYCWGDPDVTECPNDDLDPPNEVWRDPAMVFLDGIMAAGGVTVGADLADLREKEIYLGFIYEYALHKAFQDTVTQMVTDGLTVAAQKRGLKYSMFSNGIDITTADTLATNWIDNGVQPTYVDLGLATVPLQYRRVLKLFGEVGWFE